MAERSGGLEPASQAGVRRCSVPGCPAKHCARGLCSLHYQRMRNSGTTDPPDPFRQPHSRTHLALDEEHDVVRRYRKGLSQRQLAARFCVAQSTIHEILKRHGVPARRRGQRSAERHSLWQGDDLAHHQTLHRRIRRMRSPASEYTCACGQPAEQWSYNHSGHDEHTDPVEHYVFSTDVWQYDPRCGICHLVFDGRNPLPLHEILELREHWASGDWTLDDLAAEFGIAVGTTRRLLSGSSWSTLESRSPQVAYWRHRTLASGTA